MGKLIASREKPRRGELALFADVLKVSERTLRNWRDHARAEIKPVMGRPRLARDTWRAALRPVVRAWRAQGRSAGRERVHAWLEQQGIAVSSTITRVLVPYLKSRHARRVKRERHARMQHVVVHARDALGSLDATHLGRDETGEVQTQALKDVATTAVIEGEIGGPVKAEDVVALLERAKAVRGVLPLVLGLDNGPANRSRLVRAYLARERVVVLWNVPYTPQHNAPIESTWSEAKVELDARGELVVRGAEPTQAPVCSLDPGVSATRRHFQRCVPRVMRLLNQRVRPSRGGFTAAQLDALLPSAEDLVSRARFYDSACAAVERAVQGLTNARARRRAEREAVLCTLEQHGLVTRTRGRRPATCSKAERLS